MYYVILAGFISFLMSCSNLEDPKMENKSSMGKDQKAEAVKKEPQEQEDDNEDEDYEEADAFHFGPGIGP